MAYIKVLQLSEVGVRTCHTSMFYNQIFMKLKIIIQETKIIALAHLGQAEKWTKETKPLLQLTWAGWYNKQLIISFKKE